MFHRFPRYRYRCRSHFHRLLYEKVAEAEAEAEVEEEVWVLLDGANRARGVDVVDVVFTLAHKNGDHQCRV